MTLRTAPFGAALLGGMFLVVAPAAAQAQLPTLPVPAATGRIAVTVLQNGASSSGSFTVYRLADASSGAPGEQVASGQSGLAVNVAPGVYDVVVRLDGAIDRPEHWTRRVQVVRGQLAQVREQFTTAVIEVRVTAGGRRAAGAIIVRRAGEQTQLATLGSGVRAVISVGRYDFVVRHRSQEQRLTGIELVSGQGRVLTADF